MTRFIEGEERGQGTLLPELSDDYVAEDNPVRVVDVFVEELDLALLGFTRVQPAKTGRPAYHPAVLLKLYIYGYLNRIQSSRRLEREAQRNVELLWSTQRLARDFKTIANFRKDNGKAIRNVCSSLLCFASNWTYSRTRLWRSTAASSRQPTAATATLAKPNLSAGWRKSRPISVAIWRNRTRLNDRRRR